MDGVAHLISETYTEDSIGQRIPSESQTEIFVTEREITRQEWVAAGRIGRNPSILLETPVINYSGQDLIEYKGKRYSIYRTFASDEETIELYLEKKGGV